MNTFLTAAATTVSTWQEPAVVTVVITGMTLVFVILILLALIILVQGRFFDRLADRKNTKKEPQAPAAVAPQTIAVTPIVEAGISNEVIAVIMAAIATMGEGKYTLRCLSRASGKHGHWGAAGVTSNTEPF